MKHWQWSVLTNKRKLFDTIYIRILNGFSLSSTRDIVANSIHLIQENVMTDMLNIIAHNGADTNAIITALLNDQHFINVIAASATSSYTKTESDDVFYTKTYFSNALLGKVDVSTLANCYTKTESDNVFYTKLK